MLDLPASAPRLEPASAPGLAAGRPRARRRGLATFRDFADSAWSEALALAWAIGDSTFVVLPVPPAETVLFGLALVAPRRVWRLGRAALLGTLLGVVALWSVGAMIPRPLAADATRLFPGVSDAETVRAQVSAAGGAALLARAPVIGEPVGAYVLEAGLQGASLVGLAAAAALRRAATVGLALGLAAALSRLRSPR